MAASGGAALRAAVQATQRVPPSLEIAPENPGISRAVAVPTLLRARDRPRSVIWTTLSCRPALQSAGEIFISSAGVNGPGCVF
jgi:hypothetical protein